MNIKLHKQATTTPEFRARIQAAPASVSDSELACQYGVDDSTIRRCATVMMSMTDRILDTTCWPR